MKWFTGNRALGALVALTLIVGGGNLWATHAQVTDYQQSQKREQQQQQRGGEVIERKLCATFSALAKRKPPAGNPKTNPSRAYLQGQYAVLNEIGPDLGCAP